MAMLSHRLRRVLSTVSASLIRSTSSASVSIAPKPYTPPTSALLRRSSAKWPTEWTRAPARLFSTRQYKLYKEGDEITPDTVLFEGCDYNHWLITMDFPKDNPPSREEMIATYEQTCAKGLGISLEEAKKRMYACSTSTYQGFQAIMTEEESEKFRDIPGVVFILPDSYIDPVNKEYGGDKYENGVITPRPPPVQYGRTRSRDRNQQRYDRQGSASQNFQRNTQYGQQQPMQSDRSGFIPPQNYPPNQPNYGPPGQAQGTPVPPFQGNYSQVPGTSPVPPFQGNYNQAPGSQMPPYPGNYSQGPPGNFNQGPPPNYNQGPPGNFNRVPQGNYNQGSPGSFNRGPQGNYSQGGPGNYYPQGGRENPGFAQGYSGHGQNQTPPQVDNRNAEGDWRNNNPMGQSGTGQGRY